MTTETATTTALAFTREELWAAYDAARLAHDSWLMRKFREAIEHEGSVAADPATDGPADLDPLVRREIEALGGNRREFRMWTAQWARQLAAEGKNPQQIAALIRQTGAQQ